MKKNCSNSWYIIQYKPNSHKIASINLNRQGFETFLPYYETTKRINSKFINYLKPLFPGYLFVLFDVNKNNWLKIKSTIGVRKIISIGNNPVKVPSEIVNGLKIKCDKFDKFNAAKNLAAGDHVKIIKGPLSGFFGKIQKIEDKERSMILIKFLEKYNSISVFNSNLESSD